MEAIVKKWGNSLALRIPQLIAKETGLQDGSEVDIAFDKGIIVIKTIKRKYTLPDLLSQINEGNVHYEINTGEHQGNEAW